MTVTLDRRDDVNLDTVRRVAWQGERVEISEGALKRMADCKASFLRLLEDPDIVIYGVTSGYGQSAKVRHSEATRAAQAKRPPLAPATTFGPPLPERAARAIVLARLTNYLEGHAAISPHLAESVAQLLADGPLPPVPVRGHGGAGEIQALSHLFGPMAQDVALAEKDSLSLVNGSPCAAALVADAALVGRGRLDVAEQVFALSAEAIRMPLSHVAAELEALWGEEHEIESLRALRGLLAGGGAERRPYQAPVSYRILPRMLGRLRRAVAAAEHAATVSLRAITDNPVYLPPDRAHPAGRVISTGGYHNAMAWPAMDDLAAAYADLCTIADRHSAKLLDGAVSLLPDQLAGGGSDRRYLGCVPMAEVGWAEAARHAAQRTFLPGSESGGFGQNDVAPPNFLAWEHHEDAGGMLDAALAGLGLIAAKALAVTDRAPPPALTGLVEAIGKLAPAPSGPHAPGPDIARISAHLRGKIYPDAELAS